MAKKAVLTLIVMLLAGALPISIRTPKTSANTQPVDNFTLWCSADLGFGFTEGNATSPGPTLTANLGDLVNLTLISLDGIDVDHLFFIDYDNDSLPSADDPQSISFNVATVFNFTAGYNGTFYYRDIANVSVMYGLFIVNFIVPEFPSVSILTLFMAATLIGVIVYKRKQTLTHENRLSNLV